MHNAAIRNAVILFVAAVITSSLPACADEPRSSSGPGGLTLDNTSHRQGRASEALQPSGGGAELPNSSVGLLERMQQAFEALVDRVSPAVVAIRADRGPASPIDDAAAPLAWFNTGSGVIIREDGKILTSQHVIDGATAIHVRLHDGRHFRASPVATDRRSDMAVLHIDAAGLPVATLGDIRHVRRGHIVFAIGNPLGVAGDGKAAVSQGLVSAIGRPLPEAFGRDEDRYYGDMIQTSARVGPGNSGGPLVDIHGRVIGIITVLAAPFGANAGIGFAVPIGLHTRLIIDRLLEGRQIEYGYLGVEVSTPGDAPIQAAGLPADRAGLTECQGALLDSVLADGPADRAGLRSGDIIVAVGKAAVTSADGFIRLIGAAGPGQEVEITFVRDSQRHNVTVKLSRRQTPSKQHLPPRTITFRGATLGEVDAVMRDWGNLPGYALLVLMVNDGSPADRAGLTPGDTIVRVEGRRLTPDAGTRLSGLSGDILLGLANGGSVLVKE